MEQANCFMINVENGMYIMSPDESLIGSEIEDKMLLSVIEKAKQGKETNDSIKLKQLNEEEKNYVNEKETFICSILNYCCCGDVGISIKYQFRCRKYR